MRNRQKTGDGCLGRKTWRSFDIFQLLVLKGFRPFHFSTIKSSPKQKITNQFLVGFWNKISRLKYLIRFKRIKGKRWICSGFQYRGVRVYHKRYHVYVVKIALNWNGPILPIFVSRSPILTVNLESCSITKHCTLYARGLKHAARLMCLCGPRHHQIFSNYSQNCSFCDIKALLPSFAARGDIFCLHAARELHFCYNAALELIWVWDPCSMQWPSLLAKCGCAYGYILHTLV